MKDRLTIMEDHYTFGLIWIVDGEEGAEVGDCPISGRGPEPDDRSDWECWVAERIAAESGAATPRRCYGFRWETRSQATAVLRQIKEAWRHRERPLPDWAKQALAAGWKAPKGWKP